MSHALPSKPKFNNLMPRKTASAYLDENLEHFAEKTSHIFRALAPLEGKDGRDFRNLTGVGPEKGVYIQKGGALDEKIKTIAKKSEKKRRKAGKCFLPKKPEKALKKRKREENSAPLAPPYAFSCIRSNQTGYEIAGC